MLFVLANWNTRTLSTAQIEYALVSLQALQRSTTDGDTNDSQVLKYVFHLIDSVKVSLKHGLSKEFRRCFRDLLFVADKEESKKIYLLKIINSEYPPIMIEVQKDVNENYVSCI
ncbi:hypothetical protein BDC45DRAFT_536560 [Circinella umbellata]|nr:hypothetical protein BDC45DRAFT_536560 [Circinella umbellata]